ncbi:MAG: carbohydrate ABC transporter permease [Bacilli bacterium]|jgi:multiple sugar transport system permease protein|nr:carbohydrate ABC transporter permease [Bacilli bacterium]MCH4228789.1 carbohydrate ABC transporter permease [Bacilli bacterium]MCH4278239.1 carbohydrate ABC transporter permease [Bacilli bacterium]
MENAKAKKHFVFPRLKDKRGGFLNFSDYRNPAHRIGYAFIIIFLLLFSFLALFPIIYLFASSMKSVTEINSSHYTFFPIYWDWNKLPVLWSKINFGRYYLNTLIYVIGCVFCGVLFNSLLAYGVNILKPFGYKLIDKLIFIGYMIPATLNILPLFKEIVATGILNMDQDSYLLYLPLWLSFGSNAYYYMLFKDYFLRLPKYLLEAAKMDGSNDVKVFTRVVIPLSKPIIGIVAIFAMTASYSDFLLPYLCLSNQNYQTVMVAVYNLSSTTVLDTSEFLLLLVMSIVPQIVIFLLFQRQIMGAGMSKGSKE